MQEIYYAEHLYNNLTECIWKLPYRKDADKIKNTERLNLNNVWYMYPSAFTGMTSTTEMQKESEQLFINCLQIYFDDVKHEISNLITIYCNYKALNWIKDLNTNNDFITNSILLWIILDQLNLPYRQFN